MGNAFNCCQCISLVPNGHSADPVKTSGAGGEAGAGICPWCLCRQRPLEQELCLTVLLVWQSKSLCLSQTNVEMANPKSLPSSEQRKCIPLAWCLPKFLPEQVRAFKGLYPAILFRKAVFKNNHLLLQSFGETFWPVGLSLSFRTQLNVSKAAHE